MPPLPQEIRAYACRGPGYIRVLEARVAGLEAIVQHLQATIQQLTERLQQTSRTSSRPPSSDLPHALGKRPQRGPTGRRPGGQPGHEGQARVLVPVEEVDVVSPVKPERCHRCQHLLWGEDPQPQRHQVTEIPPVHPVVTEYQVHRLVCPACGEATRAAVPAGVADRGIWPAPAGDHGPGHGGLSFVERIPTPWRISLACRWAWMVANLEQGMSRPWWSRWPRRGPTSRRSRQPMWTRPGGAKAGSGRGCGRRSRRASPCL